MVSHDEAVSLQDLREQLASCNVNDQAWALRTLFGVLFALLVYLEQQNVEMMRLVAGCQSGVGEADEADEADGA